VIEQRSARASPYDLGDLVGAGGVRQDPRSPVELEDISLPTQALGDMDAEVQVKADLDVPPPVYLPHPFKHTSAPRMTRIGPGMGLATPRDDEEARKAYLAPLVACRPDYSGRH
jgi:hypothetical protein